jgi:hypothetical protein
LKKYRKSHMQQIGCSIVHYGKYDDRLPSVKHTYGLNTKLSDHIPDCVINKNTEGYHKVINDIHEEIYASTIREPLGARMDRNYNFPEKCRTDGFKFGHATLKSSHTVKDLLQTGFVLNEDEKVQKMYLKSHGQYHPSEQKNREYKWPFDIKTHSFGKKEVVNLNQAQRCLQPERLDKESFAQTRITKKNIEDFRDFAQDSLGKVRNLGQTKALHAKNQIFGINRRNHNQWDAKQCIHGEPTFAEVNADDSLGKATRFGFRNSTQPGDETRVFGTPTIRDDIYAPKQVSIANTKNFGSEPKVLELLFPHGYNHYGLEAEDLTCKRSRTEIRDIFANVGVTYGAGKFEGVWLRACDIEGVPRGQDSDAGVSTNAFLQAVKEMDAM